MDGSRASLAVTGDLDAQAPVMSVPEIVFPPQSLDHRDLVAAIRAQYGPSLQHLRGNPDYEVDYTRPAEVALKMCGVLAIDEHPMHLALPGRRPAAPPGHAEPAGQAGIRRLQPRSPPRGHGRRAGQPGRHRRRGGRELHHYRRDAVAGSWLLAAAAGLSSRTEAIALAGEGCNGGAAAILRARDYVQAHGRPALIVVGDYASPWFHLEPDLRGEPAARHHPVQRPVLATRPPRP